MARSLIYAVRVLSFRLRPQKNAFQAVKFASQKRATNEKKKKTLLCLNRFEKNAVVCGPAPRRRRAERTAPRGGPKRRSPRCLPPVWRRRDVPSAPHRVKQSWYLVFDDVTDCCCCCSLRARIHGEVRAENRFPWSLGPSPRQPTVVWRRRETRRPPTTRRARSDVAVQL